MSKSGKMSLFAPVIVLVCICFVASFMLAGVYGLTKPVIDELTERTNTEARMAVLPTADGFSEVTNVELANGVKDAFVAKNGAGLVCRTSFNGFGGAVILMVGVDANGQITGATDKGFIPSSTGATSTDGEGIVYNSHRGTVVMAREATNEILEFKLDGKATGRNLHTSSFFPKSANAGLESLTYCPETGRIWTILMVRKDQK
jgi:hypothetical protein